MRAKPKRGISRKELFHLPVESLNCISFLAEQKGVGEVLSRQLLRSGTSIGANLEEAMAGQSKADFVSKCNIALKEARETHYWLRLFKENKVVSAERLSELTKESNELIAILTTIVKKSRASE